MGNKSLLLAAALVLTSCTTAKKNESERAKLHMQIGTGYLAQGQYPLAMTELLKAEALDPKDPAILNNLGLAFYVRGRLKQAEEKFRKAIDSDPKFSDAKNNLARVLIDQGHSRSALSILQQVEGDLTYQHPEKTFTHLGMAYFELGQYQRAENYLLRSLEIRRQNCTTASYYGRSLLELKQIKKSAEALDQAIEHCRGAQFEDPLFFSAMSYFTLGEKEKTKARLEELLRDYPKSKYVAKAKGMLELLDQ